MIIVADMSFDGMMINAVASNVARDARSNAQKTADL
jgi:hypothetical protein